MGGDAAAEAAPRETVCAAAIERIKTVVRDRNYTPAPGCPASVPPAEPLGISRPTTHGALRHADLPLGRERPQDLVRVSDAAHHNRPFR